MISSGYDKSEISSKKTIKYLSGIILVIFLIIIALVEYFNWSKEEIYRQQVESSVSSDLLLKKEHDDQILGTYAVLDASSKVYRVPIEQSMKLLVSEDE